jgi:hypothetical protein
MSTKIFQPVNLDDKADLVDGKVPESQLPDPIPVTGFAPLDSPTFIGTPRAPNLNTSSIVDDKILTIQSLKTFWDAFSVSASNVTQSTSANIQIFASSQWNKRYRRKYTFTSDAVGTTNIALATISAGTGNMMELIVVLPAISGVIVNIRASTSSGPLLGVIESDPDQVTNWFVYAYYNGTSFVDAVIVPQFISIASESSYGLVRVGGDLPNSVVPSSEKTFIFSNNEDLSRGDAGELFFPFNTTLNGKYKFEMSLQAESNGDLNLPDSNQGGFGEVTNSVRELFEDYFPNTDSLASGLFYDVGAVELTNCSGIPIQVTSNSGATIFSGSYFQFNKIG